MHKVTDLLSDIPLFSSFPCTVLVLFPDSAGNFRYPGPLPIPAAPPGTPAPPGSPAPSGSPARPGTPPPPTAPHPPAEQLASAAPEPPTSPPNPNPPHSSAEHPLPPEHPPTTPSPASPTPRSLAASPEAARALVGFLPYIQRILRRNGVPERDVPDVAQTVLIQALPWWAPRTPEEHKAPTGPCRGYIATVARHAAHHRHRYATSHPEDLGLHADWLEEEQESTRSPPSHSTSTAPSAEDLWLEHEEAAERTSDTNLDRLGRSTSPAFWRAFYAHCITGTPIVDIAEAEQAPVASIYQRLHLARRDLRAAIRRFRAARHPR